MCFFFKGVVSGSISGSGCSRVCIDGHVMVEISLHPTRCSLFAALWLENLTKSFTFLYTEVAHIHRNSAFHSLSSFFTKWANERPWKSCLMVKKRWILNVFHRRRSETVSHYWGNATSLCLQRLMFCCTARHGHSGQIVCDFMVAHCDWINEMSKSHNSRGFFLTALTSPQWKGWIFFFHVCAMHVTLFVDDKVETFGVVTQAVHNVVLSGGAGTPNWWSGSHDRTTWDRSYLMIGPHFP